MTIMSPLSVGSRTTARPPRRLHGEPHDPAGAAAAHLAHQPVVGVEDREAVAGDGLHDDGLDVGQLLEGVDAAHAEVVGRDVGHDCHVVAVIAQALAQDAAPGDLHHREVDARVLQHHPRGPGARRVGLDDEALVDDDAVGRGHANLAPDSLEDVGDHPGGRRLAVRPGDGDDRHARG
jgi:hypothetical protein